MAIQRLFEKFVQRLRTDGLLPAFAAGARWLVGRTKALMGYGDQIQERRLHLSTLLNDRFAATVRYGPFRGLRLSKTTWWGNTDRAGMLLGLYEQEILSTLERISAERRRSFIEPVSYTHLLRRPQEVRNCRPRSAAGGRGSHASPHHIFGYATQRHSAQHSWRSFFVPPR